MRTAWVGALGLLAMGCALNPAPVPVEGPKEDIQALVGEWVGEYRSIETGRSGSIMFTLAAGSDTAFGDVVMVPKDAGITPDTPPATTRQAQQVLTIRFVRVVEGTVVGTIDPYPSPDCGCQLLTTFRGALAGNRIEGTFTIHHSGHEMVAQKGSWWATRKAK